MYGLFLVQFWKLILGFGGCDALRLLFVGGLWGHCKSHFRFLTFLSGENLVWGKSWGVIFVLGMLEDLNEIKLA